MGIFYCVGYTFIKLSEFIKIYTKINASIVCQLDLQEINSNPYFMPHTKINLTSIIVINKILELYNF